MAYIIKDLSTYNISVSYIKNIKFRLLYVSSGLKLNKNSTFCRYSGCFLNVSQNITTHFAKCNIDSMVFTTEMERAYFAVRTASLNKILRFVLKRLNGAR
jgi:hypothetical protein